MLLSEDILFFPPLILSVSVIYCMKVHKCLQVEADPPTFLIYFAIHTLSLQIINLYFGKQKKKAMGLLILGPQYAFDLRNLVLLIKSIRVPLSLSLSLPINASFKILYLGYVSESLTNVVDLAAYGNGMVPLT